MALLGAVLPIRDALDARPDKIRYATSMSKSKSKSKNSKSKSKSTLIDALNKRRRPQNQSRKLPENVIVEAIERYAAGESFAAIAADYLVSSATIRYHVNKVRG